MQGPRVQRQPTPTPAPTGSTLSVVRADYLRKVRRAISQIGGRLVDAHTLSGTIRPLLTRMAASPAFRTAAGTLSGGSTITHALPGTPAVSLRLRLVLDDATSPTRAGEFSHTGPRDGVMTLFIRRAGSVDALRSILVHEALHMMAWIVSSHGRNRIRGPSHAIRALDMRRFRGPIAGIRRHLQQLSVPVNRRRRTARRTPITSAQLDTMAEWLMDETLVRAETLVFDLFRTAQRVRRQRGVIATVLPSPQNQISSRMVDRYVYVHSQVFTTADRTGRTRAERQTLAALERYLDGQLGLQARRRFSWGAYGPSGIGRQRPRFRPRPLTRPPLRPLPLP